MIKLMEASDSDIFNKNVKISTPDKIFIQQDEDKLDLNDLNNIITHLRDNSVMLSAPAGVKRITLHRSFIKPDKNANAE